MHAFHASATFATPAIFYTEQRKSWSLRAQKHFSARASSLVFVCRLVEAHLSTGSLSTPLR